MIYIDMDGVLCDFRLQAKDWYDVDLAPQEMLDKELLLKASVTLSFWDIMPKTRFANDILQILFEKNLEFCFISKVPSITAMMGKIAWLDDFSMHGKLNCNGFYFLFSGIKNDFVRPKPNDILIDDFDFELEAWQGCKFKIDDNFKKEELELFLGW